MKRITFASFVIMAMLVGPAVAQSSSTEVIGGDTYAVGGDVSLTDASTRDALVAGFSVVLDGDVAGDGHAVGFDVDVNGDVGTDLDAAGAFVTIRGSVGEDLTASGFQVRVRSDASVAGNARLAGGFVRVDGPVAGALVATGGRVRLNGQVTGDVWLTGSTIMFGNEATIGGALTYTAPEPIDIPERVIAADRVTFIELASQEGVAELRRGLDDPGNLFWPSLFSMVVGFIFTTLFMLGLAAVALAFFPRAVETTRMLASERVGASLLAGIAGLSMLFGLVPVSAMTLIGIPLIPFVILLIMVAWTLGYLLGVYVLAMRLAGAFGFDINTNLERLVVLAVGFVVLALLHFAPFIGWVLNLLLVLFGLGAIVLAIVGRMGWSQAASAPAQAQPPTAPEPPAAPEPKPAD